MKCEEMQLRLADLFDETLQPGDKRELLAHIEQCPDCREAYNDYLSMASELKPRRKIASGPARINEIMEKITDGKKITVRQKAMRIAASIMIFLGLSSGLVYVTTLKNPSLAAGILLGQSIRAINSLKSVYMVFSVRTGANENFETIEPASGFIDVRVWKVFGNEPRWRFEKPGRTVIMNGQSQYLINEAGGYILKGSPMAGFVGWMRLFLEPTGILKSELEYAKTNPSACKLKEKDNQIELTVTAKARGDFSNPWALNTTIPEANTRRIYNFDKETHMLRALTVFVESGAEYICVLKLNGIKVNPTPDDSLFYLGNLNNRPVLTLDEWDQATSRGLKDVSVEEAIKIFFIACKESDWATVKRFSPLFSVPGGKSLKPVQSRFKGCTLLKIGNSFTSGIYAGVYVPYVVRLKSGDTLTGNIAIRKDNSFQTWNIDGGY